MIDRDDILRMAKDRGVRTKDMIILAPQNDPFYCGAPAQVRDGRWFAEVWHLKNDPGLHLREFHYQISTYWSEWSAEPFVMPTGKVYENTTKCWNWLQAAAKYARNLGYVDLEEIGDQYTPAMLTFADATRPLDPTIDVIEGVGVSALPGLPRLSRLEDVDLADFSTSGYGDVIDGPHVEIWAEKSSVTRYIEGLCRQYRVNLLPAKGYMTQRAIIRFMRRAEQSGRRGRILYVSDFDYSGNNMPVQVARYIEFYQQHPQYPELHDLDIRIHQLAVTSEQIDQYDLPLSDIPADKMNSRHEEWLDLAEGVVEVEAINPHLAVITEAALTRYRDETVSRRARRVEADLAEHLDRIRENLIDRTGTAYLVDDYEQLQADFDQLSDEFADLVAPFQARIETLRSRHNYLREEMGNANDVLLAHLQDATETVGLDEYQIPDPDLPDEPSALYDSRRGYIEQLKAYKQHRFSANGH